MAETILETGGKTHAYDTLLGKDIKTGEEVWVSQKDRRNGMHGLGGTGMGKSKLVTSMVIQDLSQRIPMRKDFEENIGVFVMAPDGDLLNDILVKIPKHRKNDVVLLDPLDIERPFPLNLFYCPDPTDPAIFELTVEQVISVFEKVFGMSEETPQLSEYAQAITRTLIGTPYTMIEIAHLLTNEGFRRQLVNPTSDFWMDYNAMQPKDQRQEYRTTIRRIRQLTDNQIIRNIVGQTGMLDFQQMINEHKILLVNLPGEYEHLGKLLGSIIIGQLLLAALKQKHRPENQRPYFNLYVDEFQNYATPAMNKLLAECRKYRIGSFVLHQTLYQPGITDGIRSTTRNVSTFVFFKLANTDSEELASIFDTRPPRKELPEPTIPANVLDYLPKHPQEAVKAFFSRYINRLQAALSKRERYETNYATYDRDVINPRHDFGEGTVDYDRDFVGEVLLFLEDFLYQTQMKNAIDKQKRQDLIFSMSSLLCFSAYFSYSSVGLYPQIDYRRVGEKNDERWKRLHELEEEVARLEKAKTDTRALYVIYGKGGYDNWINDLKERAENNARIFARKGMVEQIIAYEQEPYRKALREWEEEVKRRQTWAYKREFRKRFGKGVIDSDISVVAIPCGVGTYEYIPPDELRHGLSSDDAFVEMLAKYHRGQFRGTKEEVWEEIRGEADRNRQRGELDTVEKFIADIRRNQLPIPLYWKHRELAELQEQMKQENLDKENQRRFTIEKEKVDAQWAWEKAHHDRFVTALDTVLAVLMTEEGKIKTYSTEWMDSPASQQTFSDKKLEIANNLTQ